MDLLLPGFKLQVFQGSRFKVQGSRFFILSYEHSYSEVMPMKILGHRLTMEKLLIQTNLNARIQIPKTDISISQLEALILCPPK